MASNGVIHCIKDVIRPKPEWFEGDDEDHDDRDDRDDEDEDEDDRDDFRGSLLDYIRHNDDLTLFCVSHFRAHVSAILTTCRLRPRADRS